MLPNPSQRPRRQLDSAAQIRVVPYSPPRISSASTVRTADVDSPSPHPHDEPRREPDTFRCIRRTASSITDASGHLSPQHDPDNASISSRASSSSGTPSARRAKRAISISSDNKTFSLVPLSGSAASRTDSFASHGLSSIPSGSWGRVSSGIYILEDRERSPATPGPADRSLLSNSTAPLEDSSPSQSNRQASSTWTREGRRASTSNVDGKRLLFNQDDLSLRGQSNQQENVFNFEKSPSLSPKPAILPSHRRGAAPTVHAKPSLRSITSSSTLSEKTNYKIYGESSPLSPGRRISYEYEEHGEFADDDASLAPSSSQSLANYHVLAESSDIESVQELQRPFTASSDANIVLHGRRSVSCSSLISGRRSLRPEFSQESLLVAPLRPAKRNSIDGGNLVKSCSRDSLRRASLSSIGTAFSQEAARSLFIGAASVVYIQGGLRKQKSRLMASGSGSSDVSVPHPHRWSAPLSTVMSESERSSIAPSRSLSPWSAVDRRISNQSKHVMSFASSVAGLEDDFLQPSTHSRSASLEQPPFALHTRSSARDLIGNLRQVRDYDEHGDGLADLDVQLHHRVSRSRLASEHALRHSASTRSLNPLSFPTWARLYYCSGERRFLLAQASSDSIRSLYNGSLYNEQLPHGRALLTHSPSLERIRNAAALPPTKPLPQRQSIAEDLNKHVLGAGVSETAPGHEETPNRVTSIIRRLKKQTSSIRSPHLHLDRRAHRPYVWEPPSAPASERTTLAWLRNRQIVLFVLGFIMPLLWIVAAFLPLPQKPVLEMVERHHNGTSQTDLAPGNDQHSASPSVYKTRYDNARWWRNLNRVMAIVGLLVIGAVIALIVVGVKQQWTRRS